MGKRIDPDDIPGAIVIWTFAILVGSLCVSGAWVVIRWGFGL